MARSPKPWYRKDRKSWYVTIDGRRHNLGPNRKPAFQRFHEMMAKPQKREVPSESLAAIIDLFLDWTLRHRAKRTYEWYLQRTQWFLTSVGDLSIGQLQPYHVQQWIDGHPNWSDTHRRGCIIAVQRPLRWAVKMGYIGSNPLEHIEKPQAGRRDEIVSEDEFSAIMELVRDDADSCVFRSNWAAATACTCCDTASRHAFLNEEWMLLRFPYYLGTQTRRCSARSINTCHTIRRISKNN